MKSEIISDIEKAKENSIIIDLDQAVQNVYKFINETKHELSILKKMKKDIANLNSDKQRKKYIEFGKKHLYPKFKKFILNELYPENTKYDLNEIMIFIVGIYTIYHVDSKLDKEKIIYNSLKDMTDIVFKVKKEEVLKQD